MTAQPILIVEDEHALGSAIELLVRRMGHIPTLTASGEAGLTSFKATHHDAVILDIGLPDMSGLKVLDQLRSTHPDVPILMITAHATLQHAIDSQKSGATAYLTKPLDMKQFQKTLASMLVPTISLNTLEKAPIENTPDSPALIGAAPCLRETFLGIARASTGDLPLLITGASGTGKSLAARVIHTQGKQSSGPLVTHECAKIKSASVFEDANGGSLILDEITDLADDSQAALATILGSTAGPLSARLMATSIHDPLQAVRDGKLREDLYYALCPLTIPLPPLTERSGDIPSLCGFFAGLRDRDSQVITPPVMAALQSYDWPGNIRELRHVIDYAISMSQGGAIFLSHLPKHVSDAHADEVMSTTSSGELEAVMNRWLDQELAQEENSLPTYDELLQKLENYALTHLMEHFNNRPTHLANALKLHRGTLRKKLQRAGIQLAND